MSHKDTVVLYHGGCPDGFSGAYAAWKKFGDTAEYIPIHYDDPVPHGLEGKHLYFIDCSYAKDTMGEILKTAASVTVLDHHLGTREAVESMPKHVFDDTRSGATIAWSFFFTDIPVPFLIRYIQDGDLYTFKLPDARAVLSYAYTKKFAFEEWDRLVQDFEDPAMRQKFIEKGRIYAEHSEHLVEEIAKKAVLVSFEGFECYLATAANMFTSDVGAYLVRLKPPIALISNFRGNAVNVSLRSDPTKADVAAIARKYGGNGHPQSSAFRIDWGAPLPWTVIDKNGGTH